MLTGIVPVPNKGDLQAIPILTTVRNVYRGQANYIYCGASISMWP